MHVPHNQQRVAMLSEQTHSQMNAVNTEHVNTRLKLNEEALDRCTRRLHAQIERCGIFFVSSFGFSHSIVSLEHRINDLRRESISARWPHRVYAHNHGGGRGTCVTQSSSMSFGVNVRVCNFY